MSTNDTSAHVMGSREDTVDTYEWGDYDYPSTAIVERVAEAVGRDEAALDHLQKYVDCDAVDGLLAGDAPTDVEISFEYDDVFVTVTSTGRIDVWTDW